MVTGFLILVTHAYNSCRPKYITFGYAIGRLKSGRHETQELDWYAAELCTLNTQALKSFIMSSHDRYDAGGDSIRNCIIVTIVLLIIYTPNVIMVDIPSQHYVYGFSSVICFIPVDFTHTLEDYLSSLAFWQFYDFPNSNWNLWANEAYQINKNWQRNHNKAKHNITVCMFRGISYMQLNIYIIKFLQRK